jgi:hypothetical protein
MRDLLVKAVALSNLIDISECEYFCVPRRPRISHSTLVRAVCDETYQNKCWEMSYKPYSEINIMIENRGKSYEEMINLFHLSAMNNYNKMLSFIDDRGANIESGKSDYWYEIVKSLVKLNELNNIINLPTDLVKVIHDYSHFSFYDDFDSLVA